MKAFNNSVGSRTSPDFKNASVFLVKPMPEDKRRGGDYGLDRAVTKQLVKKKKKKATKVEDNS